MGGLAGDAVDELQLPVGVEAPGVGADRLDLHVAHRLGGGDEHVRRAAGGELDGEVVDGDPVDTLDDVDTEDVGAGLAQCGGDRSETARSIRQYHAEQERHPATPPHLARTTPVAGRDAARAEEQCPVGGRRGTPAILPGAATSHSTHRGVTRVTQCVAPTAGRTDRALAGARKPRRPGVLDSTSGPVVTPRAGRPVGCRERSQPAWAPSTASPLEGHVSRIPVVGRGHHP